LGITSADWRYLHDQILDGLQKAPVRSTRITPFGVAYEVVVTVDGLNGATAPVVTTWIVERNRPPRLVGGDPLTRCHNRLAMTPTTRHAVLDVVELLVDSGRWSAGTVGTVVEADAQQALVEISDDRGHALDFIALPHDVLGPSSGKAPKRAVS
jgi:hypothetical protein